MILSHRRWRIRWKGLEKTKEENQLHTGRRKKTRDEARGPAFFETYFGGATAFAERQASTNSRDTYCLPNGVNRKWGRRECEGGGIKRSSPVHAYPQ